MIRYSSINQFYQTDADLTNPETNYMQASGGFRKTLGVSSLFTATKKFCFSQTEKTKK